MIVKIKNTSTNENPEYKTKNSSGVDLKANLIKEKKIVIKPLERVLIKTGLFLEIPEGYEAQVRPRSGLCLNHGISVLNTPGTIDADYRGEVGVILINLSNEEYTIKHGERVGQLILKKVEKIEWENVLFLENSERGEGGFGHTGK
jgi:dUTP pyrophosphatase